ncbi:MAG: hypothetical protein KDA77_18405 [Planctomycetaceae bacterium]|nr:hypothetical protein [Planctomycetaceae bacterium]
MSEKSYQRRVFNLANAIQHEVGGRWRCYGSYCLIISGRPQIPKPATMAGKKLVYAARAFIDKTGRNQIQVCEELLQNEEGGIMIQNQSPIYQKGKIAVVLSDEV